ncbi:MAG: hypothetical protein J6V14_03575 [Clostridia bacterium]|nr:hypothetical protein [Clostridia bacterium]
MTAFKRIVIVLLALALLAFCVSCGPAVVFFNTEEDIQLEPNKLYVTYLYVLSANEEGICSREVFVNYPGADKLFTECDTVRVEFYGRNYRAEEKEVTVQWGDGSSSVFVCTHVITEVESARRSDGKAGEPVYDKPIIYLYPEADTVCSVALEFDGKLTCTYPEYGTDGWQDFVARPDGTLVFPDGNEYYALYWEGTGNYDWLDLSSGFCVKGADTARFLAETLPQLGLSAREANEFIIYWLPILQANPYNLISFQTATYADNVKLTVSPEPDTVIRVLMAYMPLEHEVNIDPQVFNAPERTGFTVVEWGGTAVNNQ